LRRPSAGGLLRIAVAAGLTAILFWKSHPREVAAYVADARVAPLVAAVALVILDRTLMACRWFWLLRPFPAAGAPPFGQLVRVFFVSTFVGTFLPASIGSDAIRAAALARLRVPLADAVASVFMDRVLGVVSILAMAAIGLWLARDLPARSLVLLALVAIAGACALVAAMTFSTRVAGWIVAALRAIPWPRVQRGGAAVVAAVQRYAHHHGLLVLVLVASVGVQILRIVQAWCLGLALGIALPIAAYFAFVPVILLIMLLPVTVNGLGTSQAAFVLFFARADVPSAAAFALSVLFVALGVVGNLPGGLLYAWKGAGLSAPPGPISPGPASESV
jgi:glycosyltransferase 2 family protein